MATRCSCARSRLRATRGKPYVRLADRHNAQAFAVVTIRSGWRDPPKPEGMGYPATPAEPGLSDRLWPQDAHVQGHACVLRVASHTFSLADRHNAQAFAVVTIRSGWRDPPKPEGMGYPATPAEPGLSDRLWPQDAHVQGHACVLRVASHAYSHADRHNAQAFAVVTIRSGWRDPPKPEGMGYPATPAEPGLSDRLWPQDAHVQGHACVLRVASHTFSLADRHNARVSAGVTIRSGWRDPPKPEGMGYPATPAVWLQAYSANPACLDSLRQFSRSPSCCLHKVSRARSRLLATRGKPYV